MPAHACTSCGRDLSRIHAPPDPHYQLRVVVCPDCNNPAVRADRHGMAPWRRAKRIAAAWVVVAWQSVVLLGTSAIFAGLILSMTQIASESLAASPARALAMIPTSQIANDEDLVAFAAFGAILILIAFGVSAWIRSTLAHLKPVFIIPLLLAVSALWLVIPSIVYGVGHRMHVTLETDPVNMPEWWRQWPHMLAMLTLPALATLPGIPAGKLAAQSFRRIGAARQRRQRRRRRKLRDDQ